MWRVPVPGKVESLVVTALLTCLLLVLGMRYISAELRFFVIVFFISYRKLNNSRLKLVYLFS